jgi:hypothetical protein
MQGKCDPPRIAVIADLGEMPQQQRQLRADQLFLDIAHPITPTRIRATRESASRRTRKHLCQPLT